MLEGRFLTNEPPGKSLECYLNFGVLAIFNMWPGDSLLFGHVSESVKTVFILHPAVLAALREEVSPSNLPSFSVCVCVCVYIHIYIGASQVTPVVKNLPANARDIRDMGLIPRLGRSPGGKSLQYSCLKNSMDRGAWRATIQWVAKSQTWLKQLSSSSIYI